MKPYKGSIKVGEKYGQLTVLEICNELTRHRNRIIVCECTCGKIKKIPAPDLLSLCIRSCGCYKQKRKAALSFANFMATVEAERLNLELV